MEETHKYIDITIILTFFHYEKNKQEAFFLFIYLFYVCNVHCALYKRRWIGHFMSSYKLKTISIFLILIMR